MIRVTGPAHGSGLSRPLLEERRGKWHYPISVVQQWGTSITCTPYTAQHPRPMARGIGQGRGANLTMLTDLYISNFKSFGPKGARLRLGKVTVLIGANGTGKSSALQALLLLKQSAGGDRFRLREPLIDLGEFSDIVHRRDTSREVTIGLSTSYDGLALGRRCDPVIPQAGHYSYTASFGMSGITSAIGDLGNRNNHLRTAWRKTESSRNFSEITVHGFLKFVLVPSSNITEPIQNAGSSYSQPGPNQTKEEAEEVRKSAEEALGNLLHTVRWQVDHTYVIPAVRGFQSTSYPILEQLSHIDLLQAGTPDHQAEYVANAIAFRPEWTRPVSRWLESVLGRQDIQLGNRLIAGRRVSPEVTVSGMPLNLVHEAFGMNQLLAPLLWFELTSAGSVVAVEEPEIHLHPRAQAALCDVFVDVATSARKQIILTTHSEHILMGLLTAVARGQLHHSDLCVYEFAQEKGVAHVTAMDVTPQGQVKGGLRGFLQADIENLGEYLSARIDGGRR
jgi:energy-coupling factor transporter ATP-binding protein EcfA2